MRGGDKVLRLAGPTGQCHVKSQFEQRWKPLSSFVRLTFFSDSLLTMAAFLILILVITSGVVSVLVLVP